MISKDEFVAAIDLGTSKIVTIIGKKDREGKLEILAVSKTGSNGIKRGIIQNIEETADAVRQTIEEFRENTGFKIDEVYVGISGGNVSCFKNRGFINLNSTINVIERQDLEKLTIDMHKILMDAGREIIEIFPQNYTVEDVAGIRNPVGMSGKFLEGHFITVTGESDSINNVYKCMKHAGLIVKKIIPEPVASAEAVLTDSERDSGIILVDIGAETTNLAFYKNGVVQNVAMIPFGGNQITQDIKEHLFSGWDEAENIKIGYDETQYNLTTDHKNKLTSIILARMEEILSCVNFEIEKSGFKSKLHSGMVITGGGALLKNLPQLIKSRTGLNVRVGYPAKVKIKFSNHHLNHPAYSSSFGLLIKGYEYNFSGTFKS